MPDEVRSRLDALAAHLATWVQHHDGAEHARLRATARSFFTPRAVAAWRDRIGLVTDALIDGLATTCDIAEEFGHPLPAVVLADLLGLPEDERPLFNRWATKVDGFFDGIDASGRVAITANEAVLEMEAYLGGLLSSKRSGHDADLLTHLMGQCDQGQLSEAEVYGWGMFLLLAGHENTTGLIVNGLAALLDHPEELDRLGAEPQLMATAVDELLRYDSPIQKLSRIAEEDFNLDGRHIRRGQRVWALLGAANRDPGAFDRPDELVLDRRPNRHVAFGYGIHFCIGASLARLEGEIALGRLLGRYPGIRSAETVRTYQRGVSNHRLRSLTVRLS
jgi:cytochrome P450